MLHTIVLLESPHTGETGQRAAGLVSVEHAKVGVPERELTVTPLPVGEH